MNEPPEKIRFLGVKEEVHNQSNTTNSQAEQLKGQNTANISSSRPCRIQIRPLQNRLSELNEKNVVASIVEKTTINYCSSIVRGDFTFENGLHLVMREMVGFPQEYELPAKLVEIIGTETSRSRVVDNHSEFLYSISETQAKKLASSSVEYDTTSTNQVVHHSFEILPFSPIMSTIKKFWDSNVSSKPPLREIKPLVELTACELEALDAARRHDRFAFLDEPGLGKSLPSLIFLLEKRRFVLVIAPAILHAGWMNTFSQLNIVELSNSTPDELFSDLFKQENSEKLVSLTYKEAAKLDNFAVIASNGTLSNVILLATETEVMSLLKNGLRLQHCAVLVDEFHQFKSPNANCTKQMMMLLKQPEEAAFLTATPALNNAAELYTILAALGLQCSQEQFETRYCIFSDQNAASRVKQVIGMKNAGELNNLLSRFSIRRTYVEYNQIPSIERRVLSLDCRQHSAQSNLPIIELRETAAAVLISEFCDFYRSFKEKSVVFFASLAVIEDLHKICDVIYGNITIKQRQRIILDFETGKTQKIAVSLDCAAFGIDLAVANICFFLELDWNAAGVIEAEGRIRRISSKFKTVYSILVSGKSRVEKSIAQLVENKSQLIGRLYEDEPVCFSDEFDAAILQNPA